MTPTCEPKWPREHVLTVPVSNAAYFAATVSLSLITLTNSISTNKNQAHALSELAHYSGSIAAVRTQDYRPKTGEINCPFNHSTQTAIDFFISRCTVSNCTEIQTRWRAGYGVTPWQQHSREGVWHCEIPAWNLAPETWHSLRTLTFWRRTFCFKF